LKRLSIPSTTIDRSSFYVAVMGENRVSFFLLPLTKPVPGYGTGIISKTVKLIIAISR